MSDKAAQVHNCISRTGGVQIRKDFCDFEDGTIRGAIELAIPNGSLQFDVMLLPCYPLQFQGIESIQFVNPELKQYNHVNPDGSICIHTHHSPELIRKLELDLSALQEWIDTYYLGSKEDAHYEHIFLPSTAGVRDVFLFTDFDYDFKPGDYGMLNYSALNTDGKSGGKTTRTFLIKNLKLGKTKLTSQWTRHYLANQFGVGVFIFLDKPPVKDRKYAYDNWTEFTPHFKQDFLKFLYQHTKSIKPQSAKIPLMIGYRIPSGEAHWQVAWLCLSDLPMQGVKSVITKEWDTVLLPMPVEWCETQNCSYRLFFGRGLLSNKLTEAKILVIGIGAVGSMVATTLVRGGCKQLTLIDHDAKEPGNVCRSEYAFYSGIDEKVSELRATLCRISPFVEVGGSTSFGDKVKVNFEDNDAYFDGLKGWLESYDVVIDCSTDNDLAYLFSRAAPSCLLLNLSITNHAKELVCVTLSKAYEWMIDIFKKLKNDTTDVFNPTGCWSPTFKASYNDIAVVVQYAIKHINRTLEQGSSLRNFYLATSDEGGFSIKLNLF